MNKPTCLINLYIPLFLSTANFNSRCVGKTRIINDSKVDIIGESEIEFVDQRSNSDILNNKYNFDFKDENTTQGKEDKNKFLRSETNFIKKNMHDLNQKIEDQLRLSEERTKVIYQRRIGISQKENMDLFEEFFKSIDEKNRSFQDDSTKIEDKHGVIQDQTHVNFRRRSGMSKKENMDLLENLIKSIDK